MMAPIYVQEETREMLRKLAERGESYDALLQRLARELVERRRADVLAGRPTSPPVEL